MKKISLKNWVLLLTVIPTLLISLVIAGYFSYARYIGLDHLLIFQAKNIIEPIAVASADPILDKKYEKLRQLINLTHRNHSNIIKNITVFTPEHQMLVTSAYYTNNDVMHLNKNGDITRQLPLITTSQSHENTIIFHTPIINESQYIEQINFDNQTKDILKSRRMIIGYIAMQVDKNAVQFNQQSDILIALTLMFLSTLISAYFSLRLIKKVTSPINQMVNAIEQVCDGKLETSINTNFIAELNVLKLGINTMAKILNNNNEEMQRNIEQATIDLRESLEQFEIKNVELDISKRKAQDANRVKSEFLANMSHELRTPLNGVIGFTRQVLKTPLSETQRDYLHTIDRSANNLLLIINDILDFSKLDAGKMVIEHISFSLRESIEETLILLTPSTYKKNIELSLHIAQQLPDALLGDAMRIKQVIANLVNNAIKFTEKGSVTIDVEGESITPQMAAFKISITDTGIGMNASQQKTIFETFGQADKSITRLYGGTGLGLIISQRLANEMKGDVSFVSAKNKGSTFCFSFQCELNPIPFSNILDTQGLANKHILFHEPLLHCRVAITEILESWGMQVTTSTNNDELNTALDCNMHYDLALISHSIIPTALNNLRQLIAIIKPRIPEIHIAINSNSPNLQEALLANGVVSCLSKPITPSRLNRALQPNNHKVQDPLSDIINQKIQIKVLAVDDNEANLKLIKTLLLEQVTEVVIASDGKEAVELCEHEMFALIFMDIQMPVMDGVTALENIKANTFNNDTPIIAVTAHALSEEKEKLLQQGFNAYITKPIDETILRHIIYEYCDLDLFITSTYDSKNLLPLAEEHTSTIKTDIQEIISPRVEHANMSINWSLALKRTGNKVELAQEMFNGLVDSLPEVKQSIKKALKQEDIKKIKEVIHKLNGACCYTGLPNLEKIAQEIETSLKKEIPLVALEPEFLELFEHITQVLALAPTLVDSITK